MKHKHLTKRLPAVLLVSLGLSACANAESTSPAAPLEEQVEMAKQLLATRVSTNVDQITTVSAEYVTWPNGAAGCPRPGMSYTQALIDGYRVVLAVDGREHHYHGVKNTAPFYCARPGPRTGWIMDR